jgi:hypothetical protein
LRGVDTERVCSRATGGGYTILAMPPVPSACEEPARAVAALRQEYGDKAAHAAASTGGEAWVALGELAKLREQHEEAVRALSECVQAHGAGFSGRITVVETTGSPPPGQQTVTLWDLTDSGPVAVENVAVRDGAFGFSTAMPPRPALTVQTERPPSDGGSMIDFRSSGLALDAGEGPLHVELVALPTLRIATTQLERWAGALVPVTREFAGTAPLGVAPVAVRATVTAIRVVSAEKAAELTMTASGTLDASALAAHVGMPGLGAVPFTAEATVSVTPSFSPQPGPTLLVTVAGTTPASLSIAEQSLASFPGWSTIADWLAPTAAGAFRDALAEWLNRTLPDAVAYGLGVARLPPSTSISLRTATITPGGILFQPVLGAVGTSLSTFTPELLPLPDA